MHLGILFAFGALLFWGFGDFFIQKTTRTIGTWKALFCITALGSVVLLFFIRQELLRTSPHHLALLGLVSLITLFAALFDFEALKRGKIAIVEPVIGLELPITVGLGIFIWHENVTSWQLFCIALIFIGILLTITEHHTHLHYHKRLFEKGVLFAGIGAIGMALVNFTTGVASQETSPLLTIWFVHTFLALMSGGYLCITGDMRTLWRDCKRHPCTVAAQSILDNLAWISYASATTLIPIAVTTAISESYIILASTLGILLNKEKLQSHQFLGVALTTVTVVTLAWLTNVGG